MKTLILVADFIVAIALAALTNILSTYLQTKYGFLTNQSRIGIVIVIFLVAFAAGLYLTVVRERQTASSRQPAQPRQAGLLVGEEAETGDINVEDVAGQDIIEAPKRNTSPTTSSGNESVGIYIGSKTNWAFAHF